MPVTKLLIVTTRADISLDLLVAGFMSAGFKTRVVHYDAVAPALEQPWDVVYFRDPFNDSRLPRETVQDAVKLVVERLPNAYYVDGVGSFDAMLLEDKWLQYQLLADYMPLTRVLADITFPPHSFIKKRISSRAKGVIWSVEDIPTGDVPADYIVQPRLTIVKELRVFMVGGEIVLPVAIRSSKTPGQKVRLLTVETALDPAAEAICHAAHLAMPYDFAGIDLAWDGKRYYLIEVNRSCQFKGYQRVAQSNIAERLGRSLAAKLS